VLCAGAGRGGARTDAAASISFINSIPYREWPRRRKRHPLPRPLLKNFIRDSTRRDPYPGAPFIVKEAYADRFGLAAELPARYAEAKARYDAREAKKRRAQEASEERELDAKRAKAEAKEKLRQEHAKYPMEDKLLPRNPDLAARPVRASQGRHSSSMWADDGTAF
jgi:hypothetical protein